MEFCFDFVHDPVELLQESLFTPPFVDHEDKIEITKYSGKTTIKHGEAFFFSLRKSCHISYLNGQKYLTVFGNGSVKKYYFTNDKLECEKVRCRDIPQSVDDILDYEKYIFGITHTKSNFIPISSPRFNQVVHSAPL